MATPRFSRWIEAGINVELEWAAIKITDVVVFGVPDQDMGEAVKAVVQPAYWNAAGPELERELIEYCKSRLATLKCPQTIDFQPELPRDDNGKISKKSLRDRYWQN